MYSSTTVTYTYTHTHPVVIGGVYIHSVRLDTQLLAGVVVERLIPLNMCKVIGSVLAHNRTLSKLGRTLSEIMDTFQYII